MVPPYVSARSSRPCALVRVKISTGSRAGVVPNGARETFARPPAPAVTGSAVDGAAERPVARRRRHRDIQRGWLIPHQGLELVAELLQREVCGGREACDLVRVGEVIAAEPDHVPPRDGVAS